MAELQPSKLVVRVRFPSPAPPVDALAGSKWHGSSLKLDGDIFPCEWHGSTFDARTGRAIFGTGSPQRQADHAADPRPDGVLTYVFEERSET